MIDRYVVPSYGADKANLARAIQAAVLIAKPLGCAITLMVPQKKGVSDTALGEVISKKSVKNLAAANPCTIQGCRILMRSTHGFMPHEDMGVLVVLWAAKSMLEKADKCTEVRAIIALGWGPGELDVWIAKHQPKSLEATVSGD